jgi:hypothetical protein
VLQVQFGGKRKLTIGGAFTEKGVQIIKIGDVADEARVSAARRIDPIEANRAKRRRRPQSFSPLQP